MNKYMPIFWIFLLTYFLLVSGVFYNLQNQPASWGQVRDHRTNRLTPKIFYENDFTKQYVLEGLVAAFFYCLGCVGFITLDYAQQPRLSRRKRLMAYIFSGVSIISAFFVNRTFFRIKTNYPPLNMM